MAAHRRPSRTAWATALSLLLHVLALTGMVVGLRVVQAPPEDRAIELRLVPALRLKPRPEPVHRQADRAAPAPVLQPHFAPTVAPETPAVVLPASPTPTPEPEANPLAGLKGLGASLSGRLGCDDPLGFHLTPDQRAACQDNQARLARAAKPLGPNISDEARADYDRHIRCRDTYRQTGVAPMNPNDGQPERSNVIPYWGHEPGMGKIPPGCLGFGK